MGMTMIYVFMFVYLYMSTADAGCQWTYVAACWYTWMFGNNAGIM